MVLTHKKIKPKLILLQNNILFLAIVKNATKQRF